MTVFPDGDKETWVPGLARPASVRENADLPTRVVVVVVPGVAGLATRGVNSGASVRRDVARRTSRLVRSILCIFPGPPRAVAAFRHPGWAPKANPAGTSLGPPA